MKPLSPRRFLLLALLAIAAACGPSARPKNEAARALARLEASFGGVDLRTTTRLVSADDRLLAGRVEVPLRATGRVLLRGEAMQIAFSLDGVADTPLAIERERLVYPSAIRGGDVIVRVHESGVEDHVLFERAPSVEALTYEVDVSAVAGLRLVGDGLEFLDASGTPRLRVAPPHVLDAVGVRHDAKLSVDDCAVDTSPAAPWGRPVTAPGRGTCSITVSWSGAVYPVLVDPNWTTTGSLVGARGYMIGTALRDGRVLLPGGFVAAKESAVAEIYDPSTKTFATTGRMIAPRRYHEVTLITEGPRAGSVLVTGGQSGTWTDAVELYDPAIGRFTALGPMLAARGTHTATEISGGRVLVLGGQDDFSYLGAAEIYDPATGTSVAAAQMSRSRAQHRATRLRNGNVFVSGGCGSDRCDVAEIYDVASASFSLTPPMKLSRWEAAQVLLGDGKVLIAGGRGPQTTTATAEIFDPTSGTFTEAGSMLFGRVAPSATLIGTGPDAKVLVAGGGFTLPALARSEVFDPKTGTFAEAGRASDARSLHAAVAVGDGVLVAGGMSQSTYLDTAQVFRLLAAGEPCTVGDGECVSGACQNGVCCASACAGTCMTCTIGTGACVAVKSARDPDSCRGICDAAGGCKRDDGERCAGAADCNSGHCVDGVCCNRACEGVCEACDVLAHQGTCSIVDTEIPHGTRACSGSGACAGICDGSRADACTMPDGATACRDGCSGGFITSGTCDGQGRCTGATDVCPGHFGCKDGTTCKTVCGADSDCATGATCDPRTSRCVPGATCEGNDLRRRDGTRESCGAFACRAGACLATCSSTDDCSSGAECVERAQGTKRCVLTEDGGCSVAAAPKGGGAFALLLFGLVLARRRREVVS